MKRKIFIVATDVPSLRGGAPVRNFNLVKQYLRHGYEVTVFCLYEEKYTVELERLRALPGLKVEAVRLPAAHLFRLAQAILVNRILPYMQQYRASGLAQAVVSASAQDKPDFIQFEEITAYDAVAAVLPKLKRGRDERRPKLILDAHNVEQDTLAHAFRTFSPVRRLAGQFVLPHLRKLENQAARTADVVLACSEDDARFFRRLNSHVITVANGADCAYFAPSPAPRRDTLLFMGGTSYPPNDEALRWYFAEIHERIRKHNPQMTITILGGKPPEWLELLARRDSSIQLPGYVEDVRDYLRPAAICISPMLGGSGTSLKILEYLAMGKAVVSTAVGVRGIACTSGRDVLIADDAAAFATSIIRLMDGARQYDMLTRNARELMERVYDWDVIGDQLMQQLEQGGAGEVAKVQAAR